MQAAAKGVSAHSNNPHLYSFVTEIVATQNACTHVFRYLAAPVHVAAHIKVSKVFYSVLKTDG